MPPIARPAVPVGPYLVLGLGRAGRAAVEALGDRFGVEQVRVWDDALVGDGAAVLEGVRTVVKSPGISFAHPLLEEARRRGIAPIDELELGWRLSGQPLVAVTGTNGKSTTAALIAATMHAGGLEPALAGNVEATLGAPLSSLPADHRGWVVAEVSSYQAAGLAELLPEAAVFTNLTPDHLHWHASFEVYGQAKRRVFVDGDRAVPLAVVGGDDPFARILAGEVEARGGRILTFGHHRDNDYRVTECRWDACGSHLEIHTPSGSVELATCLLGPHNASNVAAALALADGLGLERTATIEALSNAPPLAGRMERLDVARGYEVFVDFAHSPDGLAHALTTLRAIASARGGRLIAVVGVAPAGDRSTRVACGRVAREGCDHVVLCGWSLKGEPPLIALGGLLVGARQTRGGELEVVLDRRRAIARGLSLAREGDVVAILGRGAMAHLAVDAHSPRVPFDDRLVVAELLEKGS